MASSSSAHLQGTAEASLGGCCSPCCGCWCCSALGCCGSLPARSPWSYYCPAIAYPSCCPICQPAHGGGAYPTGSPQCGPPLATTPLCRHPPHPLFPNWPLALLPSQPLAPGPRSTGPSGPPAHPGPAAPQPLGPLCCRRHLPPQQRSLAVPAIIDAPVVIPFRTPQPSPPAELPTHLVALPCQPVVLSTQPAAEPLQPEVLPSPMTLVPPT